MTRPPGGGLLGRLLAAVRGHDSTAAEPPAGKDQEEDAERRIDAARDRLKAEIPPRED